MQYDNEKKFVPGRGFLLLGDKDVFFDGSNAVLTLKTIRDFYVTSPVL
jgi:hypothetical protein